MTNFVLQGNSSLEKISLRTHCPIMLRTHTSGQHFVKEVCRCDTLTIKQQIHPSRCGSQECPARQYLTIIQQEVTIRYELIMSFS